MIDTRGGDATGAGWIDPDGSVYVAKEPTVAADFASYRYRYLASRTVILHTRRATQGSPTRTENNHPISLGGILGVHNGVIWNDSQIARRYDLKLTAEVDSEVIFHLVRDRGVAEAADALEGSASIAWFRWDDPTASPAPKIGVPTVHLARLGGSPLAIGTLVDGSMVFASTPELLRAAVKETPGAELRSVDSPACGQYLAYTEGRLTRAETVPVMSTPYTYAWSNIHSVTQATTPKPAPPAPDVPDDDPITLGWVDARVRPWLRAEEQDAVTSWERAAIRDWWEMKLDDDELLATIGDFRLLDDDGDDLIVENEYESVRRLGQQFMFTRSPDGGYAYVEMEV